MRRARDGSLTGDGDRDKRCSSLDALSREGSTAATEAIFGAFDDGLGHTKPGVV